MGINLEKEISHRATHTGRTYKTPKSIRLNRIELQQLEDFKNQLKEMTCSEVCSDTQAFKALLKIARHANKSVVKKALSELL